MIVRRYGRRKPAPLPHSMMITEADIAATPTLPLAVDLRPWAGSIKDQKSEGSCSAFAGTSGREWVNRRYYPEKGALVYSPQYTYAKELIAQGSFPNDVGSDGTILCGTLIANGCCESSLYPYIPGQILMPTAAQDANAVNHVYGAYHGLSSSNVAISILGDPTPWPVMIGFTVYSSFESDEVERTGVYNPDISTENVLGGHEVVILGYDIGATPTLRPQNSPPSMLCQNSWSADWGLGGWFWMVIDVLNDPDTDMKIAHTGGPWGPSNKGDHHHHHHIHHKRKETIVQ